MHGTQIARHGLPRPTTRETDEEVHPAQIPWYRQTWVVVVTFFFLTPVWPLFILSGGNMHPRALRILALMILAAEVFISLLVSLAGVSQ